LTSKDSKIAVVGGGPAGAFCAYLLSRAGFSVVLYEAAQKVQRKVCGEYLSPSASRLFESAGLPDFLSDRFPAIEGILFHVPDGRIVEARFPEQEGRLCHGYALDRVVMEEALLKAASEAGAEIRMGCKVRSLRREAKGWELLLETGEKNNCGILIGADGRHSVVAKELGLHLKYATPRIALHCFIPGKMRDARFGEMYFYGDGAFLGLNASPAGHINFSLVCEADHAKKKNGAKGAIAHYLNQSHDLRDRLAWNESLPIHSTYPVNHSVSNFIDHRAVLIGDAGGLYDPLTGEGIYLALWSASCLAIQLIRMKEEGSEEVDFYLKKYARLKTRHFR